MHPHLFRACLVLLNRDLRQRVVALPIAVHRRQRLVSKRQRLRAADSQLQQPRPAAVDRSRPRGGLRDQLRALRFAGLACDCGAHSQIPVHEIARIQRKQALRCLRLQRRACSAGAPSMAREKLR